MNWGQRLTPMMVLATVAGPAGAQDGHQSHVRVELPSDIDAIRQFQDRIRQAQGQIGLAELATQLSASGRLPDPEQLRKLIAANPQLADMIRGLKDGDPEMFARLGQAGGLPPGMTADLIQRRLKEMPPIKLPPPNRLLPRDAAPIPPPPPVERPKPNPAEQAARQQIAKEVSDWAERFPRDRLPSSLRDSAAVKDLFHRLTDTAADALRNNAGAEGWDAQLARWEARWKAARDWLPKRPRRHCNTFTYRTFRDSLQTSAYRRLKAHTGVTRRHTHQWIGGAP